MQLNPDSKIVAAIEKRLEATGGYCPCAPDKIGDSDYLCPCKKFREEQACCCGYYI